MSKRFIVFTIIGLAIIGLGFMIYQQSSSISTDDRVVASKLAVIETKYPEYKNFEHQDSFAGQSVKVERKGNDYYFGFIVHGSGVPVVQAQCYKVDEKDLVSVAGKYPDTSRSNSEQIPSDINPIDCSGIH